MLANAPPVSPASHVHTRGGTYGSPVIWFRSWSCSRLGPGKSAGEDDLDFWLNVSRKLYGARSRYAKGIKCGPAPKECDWPRWRWHALAQERTTQSKRSEERRVGKECGSTCRSWWSQEK